MSAEVSVLESRRAALKLLAGAAGAAAAAVFRPEKLGAQSKEGDLSIVSAALCLENQAVAAYQFGIASKKLLSADQLRYAIAFQADEAYHRDGLLGAIKKLGGEPVPPLRDYGFGEAKSATQFMRVVHGLEEDFIRAYGNLAANVDSKGVLDFAAHILADEVRHLTVWHHELGLANYGKYAAFSN